MASANGGAVTLGYDGSDRLTRIAGAGTRQLLYDGSNLIGEYDSAGGLLRRYIHGPGTDNPILCVNGGAGAAQTCDIDMAAGDDRLWLLTDERGSVDRGGQ